MVKQVRVLRGLMMLLSLVLVYLFDDAVVIGSGILVL